MIRPRLETLGAYQRNSFGSGPSCYEAVGTSNPSAVYAHLLDPIVSLDDFWILAVETAKITQAARRIAVSDMNEPK